ncbi:uncharacterized protein SCODWIG_03159 [Saccharomycodes ludwigii]|uniref:Anaphase-promoting complex subunit 5 n=2 Tax=Saccharomycodes ludwigii TaxID=36035 RepID=A0A376B9N2_9ASCO|nr:uncharacterized protein SCODWIG_03159 [Saccharomycodes ludwigii]
MSKLLLLKIIDLKTFAPYVDWKVDQHGIVAPVIPPFVKLKSLLAILNNKSFLHKEFAFILSKFDKLQNLSNLITFFKDHVLVENAVEENFKNDDYFVRKVLTKSILGDFIETCIKAYDQMNFCEYSFIIDQIQEELNENARLANLKFEDDRMKNYTHDPFFEKVLDYNYIDIKNDFLLLESNYDNSVVKYDKYKESMKYCNFMQKLFQSIGPTTHTKSSDLPVANTDLCFYFQPYHLKNLEIIYEKKYLEVLDNFYYLLDQAKTVGEFKSISSLLMKVYILFGYLDKAALHLGSSLYHARETKDFDYLSSTLLWIFVFIQTYPQMKHRFTIKIEQIIPYMKNFKDKLDIRWISKIYMAENLLNLTRSNITTTNVFKNHMINFILNYSSDISSLSTFSFPFSLYDTSYEVWLILGNKKLAETYYSLNLLNENAAANLDTKVTDLKKLHLYDLKTVASTSTNIYIRILYEAYSNLKADIKLPFNISYFYESQELPYEFKQHLNLLAINYKMYYDDYNAAAILCKNKYQECVNIFKDRIWAFEFRLKEVEIYQKHVKNGDARMLVHLFDLIEEQAIWGDNYRLLRCGLVLVKSLIKMDKFEEARCFLNDNMHGYLQYNETKLHNEYQEVYKLVSNQLY